MTEALYLRQIGISPGGKFEDLPVSWACPICETEKAGFE